MHTYFFFFFNLSIFINGNNIIHVGAKTKNKTTPITQKLIIKGTLYFLLLYSWKIPKMNTITSTEIFPPKSPNHYTRARITEIKYSPQ